MSNILMNLLCLLWAMSMKFFLDVDELCNTSELWNGNQKNLLITQKPFNLSYESMCDNKKREWKRGRSWHKKERLKLQSEYSGKAVVWPLLIITYRLCSKQYIFNLLILLAIIYVEKMPEVLCTSSSIISTLLSIMV